MNDVNEYAPVFKEKSYKATVVEGKQYDSILRVEAVDADCSPQFSQICSYEIVTPDVPFTVDKDGENPEAGAFLLEGEMRQAAPSTPVGFKPKLSVCTLVKLTVVHSGCSHQTPQTQSDGHLLLTVLEAGKSRTERSAVQCW